LTIITYLLMFFGKKDPLRTNFHKSVPKEFITSQNHILCANFMKFGRPEIGKVVRYLPHKKTKFLKLSRSHFCADRAQNLSGQLQTIYSEFFPKFHLNPFTSGRVIAERVNIVQMHHKVFPILGEASSPSNEAQLQPIDTFHTTFVYSLLHNTPDFIIH